MASVVLIGRSSSHFTRVARMFAHELEVPYELSPIYDVLHTDTATYANNPALKFPTLRRPDGGLVFGAENICRTFADLAATPRRIVWPEELRTDLSRNAQELVWHAMAAQVQLVFGTMLNHLPADNPYFAKGRAGFEGALSWLDGHLSEALALLPSRDLSLFEVTLFCLVEHLTFRATLPVTDYPALAAFARRHAERPAAQATTYQFDAPRG
jgi:glutathione S-transferase